MRVSEAGAPRGPAGVTHQHSLTKGLWSGDAATARMRASTLITLPSTTAACFWKAMLAMEAAEYGPRPGTFRSCSTSAGTSPPWCSTTYLAPLCSMRARR